MCEFASVVTPYSRFELAWLRASIAVAGRARASGWLIGDQARASQQLTSVPDVTSVPGISLVHDALAVALMHRRDSGRRQLVVAMTDGEDCGSVVDGGALAELSARSDAVLHWLAVGNTGGVLEYGLPAWCTRETEETSTMWPERPANREVAFIDR